MRVKASIRYVKISALLISYYATLLSSCVAGALLFGKAAHSFGFLAGIMSSIFFTAVVASAGVFINKLIEKEMSV